MAYDNAELMKTTVQRAPVPRDRCGMAQAAELVGDRWTLLIIREALYGVTRFDAMQADLGVPRTILSNRLKKLCDCGVLRRRPYKEPGSRTRHQYALTTKGVELALPLIALMQWGDKYCSENGPAAELVHRDRGLPCAVGLVAADGSPTSLQETQLRVRA